MTQSRPFPWRWNTPHGVATDWNWCGHYEPGDLAVYSSTVHRCVRATHGDTPGYSDAWQSLGTLTELKATESR
jgi:hypothetical protein